MTLSPEGAQHGWKSDIQIPNQITWEPFYVQELDWIMVESIRRLLQGDDEGRNGVIIRGVTRGIEQKGLLTMAKTQARFKAELSEGTRLTPNGMALQGCIEEGQVPSLEDRAIMDQLREDVLNGGYYLIDYRGYGGYDPGDNVVHIFSLGSLTTEAIAASMALLKKGIYANVIVVTNTDLLLGNLAYANGYRHLRQTLSINANLYIKDHNDGSPQQTLAGRRIPIVSVHDGEVGLLDNIGSIVGVRQETLAVRKHSRCGRPADVYRYHHLDSDSVVEACGKALSETALENLILPEDAAVEVRAPKHESEDWRQLWPVAEK